MSSQIQRAMSPPSRRVNIDAIDLKRTSRSNSPSTPSFDVRGSYFPLEEMGPPENSRRPSPNVMHRMVTPSSEKIDGKNNLRAISPANSQSSQRIKQLLKVNEGLVEKNRLLCEELKRLSSNVLKPEEGQEDKSSSLSVREMEIELDELREEVNRLRIEKGNKELEGFLSDNPAEPLSMQVKERSKDCQTDHSGLEWDTALQANEVLLSDIEQLRAQVKCAHVYVKVRVCNIYIMM